VLLLDEPTRGVDVRSKAGSTARSASSRAAGKAIVLVSSYSAELLGICDRIAVMHRGVLGPARPAAEWARVGCSMPARGEEGRDERARAAARAGLCAWYGPFSECRLRALRALRPSFLTPPTCAPSRRRRSHRVPSSPRRGIEQPTLVPLGGGPRRPEHAAVHHGDAIADPEQLGRVRTHHTIALPAAASSPIAR